MGVLRIPVEHGARPASNRGSFIALPDLILTVPRRLPRSRLARLTYASWMRLHRQDERVCLKLNWRRSSNTASARRRNLTNPKQILGAAGARPLRPSGGELI